jgi:hypothetical protein
MAMVLQWLTLIAKQWDCFSHPLSDWSDWSDGSDRSDRSDWSDWSDWSEKNNPVYRGESALWNRT